MSRLGKVGVGVVVALLFALAAAAWLLVADSRRARDEARLSAAAAEADVEAALGAMDRAEAAAEDAAAAESAAAAAVEVVEAAAAARVRTVRARARSIERTPPSEAGAQDSLGRLESYRSRRQQLLDALEAEGGP